MNISNISPPNLPQDLKTIKQTPKQKTQHPTNQPPKLKQPKIKTYDDYNYIHVLSLM
jgi:hypothetical protein